MRDCAGMDDYFQKHGATLVQKAAMVTDPLHVPGRDEPMDFSGLLRKPLPGQAHAVTAIVKGLRCGKGGFNSADMGCGKTMMAIAAAWKHLGAAGRVVVMCPDHIIDKWCEEIRITVPNATIVSFNRWTDVVRYYWTIGDFGAHGRKQWKTPLGMEFVVIGRDQSKYLPSCLNMGEEKNCFDGIRRGLGGSSRRLIGYEDAVDEHGNRIWDDAKGRWKRKPTTARIYRCPSCGTPAIDPKRGVPIDVAKVTGDVFCQGRVAVELRRGLPSSEPHSGRDRITLSGQFRDAPPGKVVKLQQIWEPYKNGKCKTPDRLYVVQPCGEPFWNYVSKPNRWAPAQFIHDKMHGAFDLAIIDEIHETKSENSAQAIAAGKIMAASKKVLALTGTMIGGYAWHLLPTLFRIDPGPLLKEGIKWGQNLEFSKKYGRVDRVVRTTQEDGSGSSRSRRSTSMRRTRNGKSNEFFKVAPGVMPNLWARQLMGCSVFLSMTDLADHMPPLAEYIGCARDQEDQNRDQNDPFWTNVACEMELEQAAETERITEICKEANKELLKRGSMRFLAAALVTMMEYPDHPFGWWPEFVDEDKAPLLLGQSFLGEFHHEFRQDDSKLVLTKKDGEICTVPLRKSGGVYEVDVTLRGANGEFTRPFVYDTGASDVSIGKSLADEIGLPPKPGDRMGECLIADGSAVPVRCTTLGSATVGKFTVENVGVVVKSPGAEHSVGYWKQPKIRTRDNWCGVVTPKDLPECRVYPKERKLIEICKREKAAGNQTWVFVNMTGKRDLQPRLKALLEAEGLRVGILRARNVKPRERESWIEKQGRDYDVMLSHPKPVMTGLDLLSKTPGGHNYNAIVFYQTGTHAFVCKQASRRAWRLIQTKKCRVYYLYYRATMQHHFVAFMAKKFAAMSAIAGDFSMDGLIAMGGGEDGSLALCKSLDDVIDDSVLQVNWAKAQGSYGTEDREESTGVCEDGFIIDEIIDALAGDPPDHVAEEAGEASIEFCDDAGREVGAAGETEPLGDMTEDDFGLIDRCDDDDFPGFTEDEIRDLSQPLVEAVDIQSEEVQAVASDVESDEVSDELEAWFFTDEELELLNI